MSKHSNKHQVENIEQDGGDLAADTAKLIEGLDQGEVQSMEPEMQSTEPEEQQEPQQEVKPAIMGIGQFVRHLLKNSTKSNSEILELVLKKFEGSKTTPACIAWYKTDMRKKGLLDGGTSRGKNKIVEFTAEELAELVK